MNTEEIKADINIRPEELEAVKKAQVIRLTDGTEYVRKDVAAKVMEDYAGKELASLKKVVKELIPIAEKTAITVDDPNWKEQWEYKRKVIDRAKRISDNK